MHDFILLAAALAYLGAVILLYQSILKSATTRRNLAVLLACIGLVLHAVAQYSHWFPAGVGEVNILNVLSLCGLVVVALLVLSIPLRKPLFEAGLVLLPIVTVVLVAEWGVRAPARLVPEASADMAAHVLSSVMAFGVLSIAAVYALFVAFIDHFLRRHHLNALMRRLPALEVLESLLFRLIAAGFILLTVSLGTGLVYVEDLFEQHLAHKTFLSVAAWLIFGLLLLGRRMWGWRGRLAVRLTLAGVLVLLLSYFGSKLVLEVLLERGWQS
jgi:ABC-type uncharacterized transport system permease subunit